MPFLHFTHFALASRSCRVYTEALQFNVKMSLPDLPNELLLSIANNLKSERDLSSFTRTNAHLHNLLSDYLYENNIKQHGSSALLWAAQHGQDKTAQRLLEKGASVNVQARMSVLDDTLRPCDGTPLFIAAKNGFETIVRLLIENDADVNSRDEEGDSGWTPLFFAVVNGHEAVVRLLVKDSADTGSRASLN